MNYEIYCYYNSQTPATSPKAREYCQRYGGDLLSIQSETEFQFIQPRAAAIIGDYKLAHVGYFTLVFTSMLTRNSFARLKKFLFIYVRSWFILLA